MSAVLLLDPSGRTERLELREPPALRRPDGEAHSRRLYAAAHVVPRRLAENVPGAPADIDWDATLAIRRELWSWGLGVADAMDTAQRGAGLDPAATRELIRRSASEAHAVGGRLAVGVGTDHREEPDLSLDEIVDAYREQLHRVEDVGAGAVLMASRHLARTARTAADYRDVYRRVLDAAGAPVILHWLGAAFDPALAGYFGSSDPTTAGRTLLTILEDAPDRVLGVKLSLLDAAAEVELRAKLPAGVRMYTGDDFHYTSLIEGNGEHDSDALLGAFSAIAPLAATAAARLDSGDVAAYRAILTPTEDLSRHIFRAPTYFYKTGIAFLAWLNGHQPAFTMVAGLHAARSLPHLSEVVRLANACGALEHPDLAADRWARLLAADGFEG